MDKGRGLPAGRRSSETTIKNNTDMNFIKTFLAGVLAFVVGCFLVCYIGMMILVSLAGSFEQAVTVPEGSILEINLDETVTDSPANNPLAGFDFATMTSRSSLSIPKAMGAIEAAAEDSRIRGIYLRLNGGGGVTGSALMEELRGAIADFKQSGKFVVAYNEVYSQGGYYLASVADSVYLHPEGGMDWSGLNFNLMFYKGLLDKLDLRAGVFRPTGCKYKSAVEPYILDRMSDANRQQMQELVNSLWGTIVGAVSEARNIPVEELNRIADNLEVTLPEDALEKGLVDGLLYEDQMKEVFASYGLEADEEGDYNFVTLGEYAAQTGLSAARLSQPAVAVVYADGAIVDGQGSEMDKIYGNTLAATLADVRRDEKVKSVVLRVNSPGGSALASDIIWRELELLRAEKPVIVSMGSYAASGGYYISCPADAIVADRMTLTGSIGVYGMYLYTPQHRSGRRHRRPARGDCPGGRQGGAGRRFPREGGARDPDGAGCTACGAQHERARRGAALGAGRPDEGVPPRAGGHLAAGRADVLPVAARVGVTPRSGAQPRAAMTEGGEKSDEAFLLPFFMRNFVRYGNNQTYQGIHLRGGARARGLRRRLPRDSRPLVPTLRDGQGVPVRGYGPSQVRHGDGFRRLEAHRGRGGHLAPRPRLRAAPFGGQRPVGPGARRAVPPARRGRLPAYVREHARRLCRAHPAAAARRG